MKPSSINHAAAAVLGILGFTAIETVSTLCFLAVRQSDPKDIKEIAVFALGAIAGVLAKTGVDAVKTAIGPVSGDVNLPPNAQDAATTTVSGA